MEDFLYSLTTMSRAKAPDAPAVALVMKKNEDAAMSTLRSNPEDHKIVQGTPNRQSVFLQRQRAVVVIMRVPSR